MTILTKISETINVISRDLKKDTPALVKKHFDGYTIILNTRYSFERQQQALKHELKHIEHNHFELASASIAEVRVRKTNSKVDREPFLYFMFEGLAVGEYLKERERQFRPSVSPMEATKAIDAYIAELKKKEGRKNRRRRKKPSYCDPEADYYPPGAYEEMKQRGWIS